MHLCCISLACNLARVAVAQVDVEYVTPGIVYMVKQILNLGPNSCVPVLVSEPRLVLTRKESSQSPPGSRQTGGFRWRRENDPI